MLAQVRPDIARVAEETVLNLKELENRIEVLKNDLAQLCTQIGHPEAARVAVTPARWFTPAVAQTPALLSGLGASAFGGIGVPYGFGQGGIGPSGFGQGGIGPSGFGQVVTPFANPLAGLSPFATATPFGVPYATATPFVSPFAALANPGIVSPFAAQNLGPFSALSSPFVSPYASAMLGIR